MVKKCILIILDGLGDRSHDVLNNKTPLQAAHTPCLDSLAERGANGLFQPVAPGLAPPSENAHFNIFGYPPSEFPGRGLLEAMGAGIEVADSEVALLAHFVSFAEEDGRLLLAQKRPPAEKKEIAQFARTIRSFAHQDISCRFIPTHDGDGVVILQGDVSPKITDTDPLFEGQALMAPLPWQSHQDHEASQKSAQALHAYLSMCHHTLNGHEANWQRAQKGMPLINGLVTQRPGQNIPHEDFLSRWGLRGLSISSGLMYWGLAKYLGMDVGKLSDSSDPGMDLAQRLKMARSSDHDFIHVHSKAADAAAHTKNPLNKVSALESLDEGLASVVDSLLDDETVLVVTADHSTPCAGPQIHSGEPVPICVAGPGLRRDQVKMFDEVQCTSGALGSLQGQDFMPLVLNWLDRAKLMGLMDNPLDRPYWPGQRQLFKLIQEKK
ncbi:MAG: alkaline phosphatase family protein [Thermodesulfobacteriota bacterium]